MQFSIMVACTNQGGIGKNGTIPWHLPPDWRYFQRITTASPPGKTNAIIMGRKTWESLPKKPLADRLNVVISSTVTCNDVPIDRNLRVFSSLEVALEELKGMPIHKIFVIGGEKLYQVALEHPYCTHVYVTRVMTPEKIECDTHFPLQQFERSGKYTKVATSPLQKYNRIEFVFEDYEKSA